MESPQRKAFKEQYTQEENKVQTETDRIMSWLTPKYDEGILFIIAISTILIVLINQEARAFLLYDWSGKRPILNIFLILGLLLSLVHIFIKRKKGFFQNEFMTAFAVFISFFAAIKSGIYILAQSQGWLIIFPVWSIINGLIILMMYRAKQINISDEDKSWKHIVPGLIITCTITLFAEFYYHLYWAIALSIALNYAITINKFVEKMIKT
ncbi:hypothetical protein J4410_05905 [Candidatus Woesearchaeota archaeon]|nr:hypothetical protein [Candidatus Woesearchaeota archaeon]